jgi:saccharopine dehydrogenase-like NADP-dependent oxidoreductase
MTIVVLGAGRTGSVVAMDLAHSGAKSNNIEIGIGDIDIERSKSVAKKYHGKAVKVDITKSDEFVEAIHGYDVVVNASWYEFNIQVMKACFKARCDYNDLGGLFHVTQKQLGLNSEARRVGISAIVGGGESPGITNVMAKFCAEDLDSVEDVAIYAGARERRRQKGYSDLGFPFSVSTVIDEYSKKPVEFLNGKFVELPPLSGSEQIRFPEPVGMNTVHYSIHSEPATLPFTLGNGVRNVEFKLGISEVMYEALKPLIDMGFVSEEKIPINGTAISPKEFLVSFFNKMKPARSNESERYVCLRSVVAGLTRGKRKKTRVKADLVCGPRKKLGLNNATAYLTGVAGSIFGQLLASDKVRGKGVIAPELAVDPSLFLSELKTRGILVSKQSM